MIPLSIPNLSGNEWKYIKECIDTNWVSSVGSYVDKFERSVADFTGAKFAVATVNGTSALHIGLLSSGVERNDIVLVPNLTFIASANSVKYTGAEPVFFDIDNETWQIDLNLVEQFLHTETITKWKTCFHKSGKRIKAIMPVHILGNMCDTDRLMDIARKYHLEIIEDATESLGSFYKKKHSGTFGKFGCLSFNGNKIITTGGGGMIITNSKQLAEKAKHLTTQAKSDSFEYVHDEIGYNYRLVNILAAMGVAQMEQLPLFLKRKQEIRNFYEENLRPVKDIEFQKTGKHVKPNNWLITIRCSNQKKLVSHLLKKNIQVRPFWMPMNRLRMFKNNIYITENDVAGEVYKKCISLPCSTNLTDKQLKTVVKAIKDFCGQS